MADSLYSIRMHASRGGSHLSGAERLVDGDHLESVAVALLRRALEHPRGRAEEVRLSVEALVPEQILGGTLPDLTTVQVENVEEGRGAALYYLGQAGVRPKAADWAMADLAAGPAPGGRSMRGAMLVDAESGERREPDRAGGVRVSRMDLEPALESRLRERLRERGLDNPHVREALTLAAKVLTAPEIVAARHGVRPSRAAGTAALVIAGHDVEEGAADGAAAPAAGTGAGGGAGGATPKEDATDAS